MSVAGNGQADAFKKCRVVLHRHPCFSFHFLGEQALYICLAELAENKFSVWA
jgi:hypothetical protein